MVFQHRKWRFGDVKLLLLKHLWSSHKAENALRRPREGYLSTPEIKLSALSSQPSTFTILFQELLTNTKLRHFYTVFLSRKKGDLSHVSLWNCVWRFQERTKTLYLWSHLRKLQGRNKSSCFLAGKKWKSFILTEKQSINNILVVLMMKNLLATDQICFSLRGSQSSVSESL